LRVSASQLILDALGRTTESTRTDRNMGTDKLLKVHLNPLVMLELDEPWASATRAPLSEAAFLRYVTAPDMASDLEALAHRYREISQSAPYLTYAPVETRILQKLVWPLRHAKAAYVLGSYLATIALAGTIAEMVAMLIWEMSEPQLNGRRIDQEQEVALFGSHFENLGQERRVSVLRAYSLAPEPSFVAFDVIRSVRRRYLHLWSHDHDRLAPDALSCFKAATQLVSAVIGSEIKDGQLRLSPELSRYLERRGALEEQPADGDPGAA